MGGEGDMAHLCYHVGFIRRDYIFTQYLVCIPWWSWKMQGYRGRGGRLKQGWLPLGREGWWLIGELGWKKTRYSGPNLSATVRVCDGVVKLSCHGQQGKRLKCVQERWSCRDVRGIAWVWKGFSKQFCCFRFDKVFQYFRFPALCLQQEDSRILQYKFPRIFLCCKTLYFP